MNETKGSTEMDTVTSNRIALGTVKATLRIDRTPGAKKPYTVMVREFKFDNNRQEAYWVTTLVRTYQNREAAIAMASRFGSYETVAR